ncbi:hypothetical protein V6N13_011917 [Hibiscus sabdariffa]|uniref:Uncharacterized protein n=1 Tax=Hibiscus sabdariffa TaxID=183260 RepID=A0ABR2SEJ7_9ROSI
MSIIRKSQGHIDPTLQGQYDQAEMLILVTVALQCAEEDTDAKPSMGEAVRMFNPKPRGLVIIKGRKEYYLGNGIPAVETSGVIWPQKLEACV